MASHRSLSWTAALRDLRADRTTPQPVREVPLRFTGSPLALTSWRGQSGARYVCIVLPVDTTNVPSGVVLHVARDASGVAMLVRPESATELHVHRLAETAADRAALLADLTLDRAEIEASVEGMLTVLDALDGEADLEDGADAEPSLAAPEGNSSQIGWCRGSDADGEIAAPAMLAGLDADPKANVVQVLRDSARQHVIAHAAALLARPEAWTRGASARDRHGLPVPANSPLAVVWDLGGALDRAAAGNTEAADAAEYALYALGQQCHGPAPMGLAALNDALGHADVVALLRDARHLHG